MKSGLDALALFGGRPVRNTPLSGPYPGALMIGKEEEKAVLRVLREKNLYRFYGPGKSAPSQVSSFEKAFAGKIGTHYALGVSSGTAALSCALRGMGIGLGDEVIVPAFTYVGTPGAVVSSYAVPVFAEVDESLGLDPADVEGRITKRTKAIIPVHMLGAPCKMAELMRVARKHKLLVLEDCAQSCGAFYRGRRAGSIGDMGIFSFQLNKIITAGEGGAVVTNNYDFFERAVRCHDHGAFRVAKDTGGTPLIGEGYRMCEMSGAIAGVQLRRLERIIANLRRAKNYIQTNISDLKGITFRKEADPKGEAAAAVVFFVSRREQALEVIRALNAENIRAVQMYNGLPPYRQPQFLKHSTVSRTGYPFTYPGAGKVVYEAGMCPKSEDLMGRMVCITLNASLSKRDLNDIVEGVRKVAAVCI